MQKLLAWTEDIVVRIRRHKPCLKPHKAGCGGMLGLGTAVKASGGRTRHKVMQAIHGVQGAMLMGHAHKAKATVLPCRPVIDQVAVSDLPTGLEQGTQACLIHACRYAAHKEVVGPPVIALPCRSRHGGVLTPA